MRKIIQIVCVPADEEKFALLIALCNDGTLWKLPQQEHGEWCPLKPIPQPSQPKLSDKEIEDNIIAAGLEFYSAFLASRKKRVKL
jgi:hypothetical protein